MRIERRMEMLNRRAASRKSMADEVIGALDIKERTLIADIGPGGGYFTRKLAFLAGASGEVHAMDINSDWLEILEDSIGTEGWENIFFHSVDDTPETYPDKKFDLVFMRNVCHHIGDKAKYFEELKDKLLPGGKVVVIDYRPGRKWSFTGLMGHNIDQDKLIRTMMDAGYVLEESHGFLPEQSFNIFSVNL